MVPNTAKNRERDPYSFANINLLGRCNIDCFFCLGKDIKDLLGKHDQTAVHFSAWQRFGEFLARCRAEGVDRIYVTGQNTDSLLYRHLDALVDHLHAEGFRVGLRTNGYEAAGHLDTINKCDLSAGYSIHSLDPMTTRMIVGRRDLPDWERIIPMTARPRISIVLNRCNEASFFPLLRFAARFPNVRYVQVRRVSTDTRADLLAPDIAAYERVYTQVSAIFPLQRKFAGDAEVYDIYGKDVVFWRTVRTTVNSLNYFTDGTVSDLYFVVEGYLKYAAGVPGSEAGR